MILAHMLSAFDSLFCLTRRTPQAKQMISQEQHHNYLVIDFCDHHITLCHEATLALRWLISEEHWSSNHWRWDATERMWIDFVFELLNVDKKCESHCNFPNPVLRNIDWLGHLKGPAGNFPSGRVEGGSEEGEDSLAVLLVYLCPQFYQIYAACCGTS